MDKMKFIKFSIVTACLLLTVYSCNSFLTIDPDNKTVSEGYYTSAQRVEQAVTGAYVDFRKALLANYAWLMYGEARAGDLTVDVDYYTYVAEQNLTADDDDLAQLTDWEYFYDAISDANKVLEIVEEVDEDVLTDYQYNLYKGEALAIKSLSYFYIARVWGEAPSAEDDDFGTLLDESSAVEKAISFAEEAKSLLPWLLINDDGIESSALSAIHFNKTAITMLLAQENLWLGNDQETYDLLTQTFTTNTEDSISSFGLSTGTDDRIDITEDPLDGDVVTITIKKLDSIYPEDDERRSSMYTISEDDGIATLVVEDDGILPLLTKNELYLLLAEAAWKTGNLSDAVTNLTLVSSGATEDYSTLTEDTFEDALILERQRLLMGTGQRFFDLMRFGKLSQEISALTEDDVENGAAYWPLSQNSMNDNSLSQNSYWSN